MAYGTIKVDTIIFTNGGSDQSISVSGVVQSISGDITATGTIQGATIIGTSTVSGATVTGDAGQFTTATITSGVFASGTAAAPSISVGTTDNGIYSPGTDEVAISTNGTGRLFVDASGNVKVEKTATNPNFAVVSSDSGTSTIGLGDVTNNFAGSIAYNNSTNAFTFTRAGITSYTSQNDHIWYTSGTEKLRITSDGKLGLGTSNPSGLIHLQGASIAETWYTATNTGGATWRVGTADTSSGLNGAYRIYDATNSAARLLIDSSGNVGVGTTSPSELLHVAGTARIGANDTSGAVLEVGAGATGNRNAIIDLIGDTTYTDFGLRLRRQDTGANTNSEITHRGTGALQINAYDVAPITFFTGNAERARIDSSGRLLVGTSTARSNFANTTLSSGFQLEGVGAAPNNRYLSVVNNYNIAGGGGGTVFLGRSKGTTLNSAAQVTTNDQLGHISFQGADGTNLVSAASIEAFVDAGTGTGDMPGRLVFSTTADGASSPTERMRISSDGYAYFSPNSSYFGTNYHSFDQTASQWTLGLRNSNASPNGLVIGYSGAAPNGTANRFLYCFDTGTTRAEIRSNGGLANYQANNVNLSDRNAKKDISFAADTWDCIKEWEIVNYRYKDQPDDTDLNLGVIAQQVAESCPEVITIFQEAKDDQPEKLGVKEQQMYWMAIKALQEAQVRIEALEAEVAALKAQ